MGNRVAVCEVEYYNKTIKYINPEADPTAYIIVIFSRYQEFKVFCVVDFKGI